MISKKRFGMLAAGAVVAVGAAFAATSLTGGTAHAQEPGTFSLTSVNTYQQTQFGLTETYWEAVFSVTCTAGDGAYVKTDVSQTDTWSGEGPATGPDTLVCNGSPQEVDVTLNSSSSSGTWIFGAGTVSVSATLFVGNDLFVNGSTGKPVVTNAVPVAGFANQSAPVN